jgi:hypothetical protein
MPAPHHVCAITKRQRSAIGNDIQYLLTTTWWTPGGSSIVHIYTQTTNNNTMTENTQIITYVTIGIHNHNNKNT